MKEETFEFADDIVAKACAFAVAAHSGQYRKDGFTPAVLHAMDAAVIAAGMTHDKNVMAAALLHDTVEDTDVTAPQILKMFGKEVAALVASETEEKRPERPAEETWQIRKEESLEELRNAKDINVKILWLSDKLSNIRSFYRTFRTEGDAVWNCCHVKDKTKQEWYYREVAKAMPELADTAAYEEYTELLDKLFGKKDNT